MWFVLEHLVLCCCPQMLVLFLIPLFFCSSVESGGFGCRLISEVNEFDSLLCCVCWLVCWKWCVDCWLPELEGLGRWEATVSTDFHSQG